MAYHNVAKRLASKGRGPDTTLVHMSKGEVKSLQDIARAHGGSLSVNPNTGLPEAGFLSNILPVVAGAALTYFSGGALSPMAAAMIAGGGTALATGDIKKGLSAGLGAYGGAGLGAGLAGAGSAGATASALGVEGAATGAGSQSAMLAAQNQGFGQAGLESLGQSAGYASGATPVVASAGATPSLSSLGNSISSLGTEAGRAGFMEGVGGASGLAKYGMAAFSPMMMSQQDQPQITPTAPANRLTYQPNVTTPFPQPDVPGYDDLGRDFGRQQQYFSGRYVDTGVPFKAGVYADGGSIESYREPGLPRAGEADTGDNARFPTSAVPTSIYATAFQQPTAENILGGPQDVRIDPYTGAERLAGGGVSHLGDYSDGGRLLRGPGDGVSDSIPAVIGKKQPARLADGEFVVPARIVSELGNGSTEAGARKLYAMLDRVQSARGKTVGKGKVAKNTKAEKYLPA